MTVPSKSKKAPICGPSGADATAARSGSLPPSRTGWVSDTDRLPPPHMTAVPRFRPGTRYCSRWWMRPTARPSDARPGSDQRRQDLDAVHGHQLGAQSVGQGVHVDLVGGHDAEPLEEGQQTAHGAREVGEARPVRARRRSVCPCAASGRAVPLPGRCDAASGPSGYRVRGRRAAAWSTGEPARAAAPAGREPAGCSGRPPGRRRFHPCAAGLRPLQGRRPDRADTSGPNGPPRRRTPHHEPAREDHPRRGSRWTIRRPALVPGPRRGSPRSCRSRRPGPAALRDRRAAGRRLQRHCPDQGRSCPGRLRRC